MTSSNGLNCSFNCPTVTWVYNPSFKWRSSARPTTFRTITSWSFLPVKAWSPDNFIHQWQSKSRCPSCLSPPFLQLLHPFFPHNILEFVRATSVPATHQNSRDRVDTQLVSLHFCSSNSSFNSFLHSIHFFIQTISLAIKVHFQTCINLS